MTQQDDDWVLRPEPLVAAAVHACGAGAGALARAAADRIEGGASLEVALDDACVLVLGDDLPWVPGAAYLGWEADALVSTTHTTRAPVDLVRQAVEQRAGAGRLVVLAPGLVLVAERVRAAADPARLRARAER